MTAIKTAIIALAAAAPLCLAAQSKVATVDDEAVYNAMPEKMEAEAQLKEMADMYQLDVEQVKKWVNIEDVKKDVVGKKTVDFLVANAKAIVAEKPKKTTKKAAAKKEEEKPADAE